MNELSLAPFREERTTGTQTLFGTRLVEHISRKLVRHLIVKADLLVILIGIVLVHLIVLTAPLREQTFEDVLSHIAIELDDLSARRFRFAPKVVEKSRHSPSRNAGTLVEAVVSTRAGLDDNPALGFTPRAYGIVDPLHIHKVGRLQEVILGVGLGHELVDGSLYDGAFLV